MTKKVKKSRKKLYKRYMEIIRKYFWKNIIPVTINQIIFYTQQKKEQYTKQNTLKTVLNMKTKKIK